MNGRRYLIGLGNYSKNDDGIGLRIIERLVELGLESGFEAVDVGNDGMQVLTYFLPETELIVIVDCAMIEKDPGEYVIFSPDEVETRKVTPNVSTHEGDIMKLISLARDIGHHIPNIRIMAIQPESLGMDMTLSSTLSARLDQYVEIAIKEVSA